MDSAAKMDATDRASDVVNGSNNVVLPLLESGLDTIDMAAFWSASQISFRFLGGDGDGDVDIDDDIGNVEML